MDGGENTSYALRRMTKANKVKLKGRHIGFRMDADVEEMLEAEIELGKRGDSSDIANGALRFYLAAPPAVKHAVRYGVPEDMTDAFEEMFVQYARQLICGQSPNSRGDAPIDSDAPKVTPPAPKSARKGEQNTPAQ